MIVAEPTGSPSLPTDPASRTDQELIAAANVGDYTAFEELYVRYREWVVRLAQRFTHDEDQALDVLQEVFIYS